MLPGLVGTVGIGEALPVADEGDHVVVGGLGGLLGEDAVDEVVEEAPDPGVRCDACDGPHGCGGDPAGGVRGVDLGQLAQGAGGLDAAVRFGPGYPVDVDEGGLGALVAIDAVGASGIDVAGEGVPRVVEPAAHDLECSGELEQLAGGEPSQVDRVEVGDPLGEGVNDHPDLGRLHGTNSTKRC